MTAPPEGVTEDRRLTTHVLDASRGVPAAGLAFSLSRLEGEGWHPLVCTATNGDGRTDVALLTGAAVLPGRYELAFAVGDFFAGRDGAGRGEEAYLDVVPVHFGVVGDTRCLHVALLITPWSYTTYRGS
jgi:5-hydroxyisourate hydrolase